MSCGRNVAHEIERRLDVAPLLAGVTELEKESDVDARRLQEPRSFANLLDPHTFSIASRMRCDPDSAPIHTMRQLAATSARTIS